MKKILTMMCLIGCFLGLSGIFVGCNNNNQTNVTKAGYSVKYIYEKADGQTEDFVCTYIGNVGEKVFAVDMSGEGYTLDDAKSIISGIITDDGNLQLKHYYTINKNDIALNNSSNSSISLSINNELSDGKSVFYGQSVTVLYEIDDEYDFNGIIVKDVSGNNIDVVNNSFVMPDSDVTVSLNLLKKKNIYIVRHYVKSLDDQGYEIYLSENCFGESGDTVYAVALDDEGLRKVTTINTVDSGIISQEEPLILKLYYERKTFNIQKTGTDSIGLEDYTVDKTTGISYKRAINVSVSKEKKGYIPQVSFNYNDKETVVGTGCSVDFYMPNHDINIVVKLIPINTTYKMQYYCENLCDDGFSLFETVVADGLTGSVKDIEDFKEEGFILDGENINNVLSSEINGDGTSILKAYYKRIRYTVSFVDYDGISVLSSQTYRYGESLPLPPTNNFIESNNNAYFWCVDGEKYDSSDCITKNLTVKKTKYDVIVSNFEEFLSAFHLEQQSKGLYISNDVISNNVLLCVDIDFNNALVQINGFTGLLEGNGYSISNCVVYNGGLFLMMDGEICDLSFINMNYSAYSNPYVKIIDDYGNIVTDIIGNSGLIANTLSGKIENVYLNGSMDGEVYAFILWDGSTPSLYPYGTKEGKAYAGFVAFNASGATIKNLIIDVHSSFGNGKNVPNLNAVCGVGVFDAENLYVVTHDANYSDLPIMRNTSISDYHGEICTVSGLYDCLVGNVSNEIWDIDNIVNNISNKTSPMLCDSVVNSDELLVSYNVNYYVSKNSREPSSTNIDDYILVKTYKYKSNPGNLTSAEIEDIDGYFSPQSITQKRLVRGEDNDINIFYGKDLLRITFEVEDDVEVKQSTVISGKGYNSNGCLKGQFDDNYNNCEWYGKAVITLNEEQIRQLSNENATISFYYTAYFPSPTAGAAFYFRINGVDIDYASIWMSIYTEDAWQKLEITDRSIIDKIATDGEIMIYIYDTNWQAPFTYWIDDLTVNVN